MPVDKCWVYFIHNFILPCVHVVFDLRSWCVWLALAKPRQILGASRICLILNWFDPSQVKEKKPDVFTQVDPFLPQTARPNTPHPYSHPPPPPSFDAPPLATPQMATVVQPPLPLIYLSFLLHLHLLFLQPSRLFFLKSCLLHRRPKDGETDLQILWKGALWVTTGSKLVRGSFHSQGILTTLHLELTHT